MGSGGLLLLFGQSQSCVVQNKEGIVLRLLLNVRARCRRV